MAQVSPVENSRAWQHAGLSVRQKISDYFHSGIRGNHRRLQFTQAIQLRRVSDVHEGREEMADWSIKIVEIDGVASFVTDFPDSQQGDPLQAMQGDLVSWNNTTENVHQPWETDSNYNPKTSSTLSNIIAPGQSSNWYNCSQPTTKPRIWTVYYYCSQHPSNQQERGTIEVAVPPQSFEIKPRTTLRALTFLAASHRSDHARPRTCAELERDGAQSRYGR